MPSMAGEESLAIVWLSPSVNLAANSKLSVASKQPWDV